MFQEKFGGIINWMPEAYLHEIYIFGPGPGAPSDVVILRY
jgi:hypothetical protein